MARGAHSEQRPGMRDQSSVCGDSFAALAVSCSQGDPDPPAIVSAFDDPAFVCPVCRVWVCSRTCQAGHDHLSHYACRSTDTTPSFTGAGSSAPGAHTRVTPTPPLQEQTGPVGPVEVRQATQSVVANSAHQDKLSLQSRPESWPPMYVCVPESIQLLSRGCH